MPKEIYISLDVEADGPIPGENSMLSLGAVAIDVTKDIQKAFVDSFSVNLLPLVGARSHPDQKAWWDAHPDAWQATQQDQKSPAQGMQNFRAWLKDVERRFQGRLVVIGWPVTYDFMFAYWYLIKFTGYPAPFGFAGLDLKTWAMKTVGSNHYRNVSKQDIPKEWRGTKPHTHIALDDAKEQGVIFYHLRGKQEDDGWDIPSQDIPLGYDDDTPLYGGRLPLEQRPRTGQSWTTKDGFLVGISSVDPWGRWFNYTREDESGALRRGRILQEDILAGRAKPEECKE